MYSTVVVSCLSFNECIFKSLCLQIITEVISFEWHIVGIHQLMVERHYTLYFQTADACSLSTQYMQSKVDSRSYRWHWVTWSMGGGTYVHISLPILWTWEANSNSCDSLSSDLHMCCLSLELDCMFPCICIWFNQGTAHRLKNMPGPSENSTHNPWFTRPVL